MKVLVMLVSLVFMGCMIGESEFKHMPTYSKTLIYTDDDITVYMIEEFDGYETTIYYINNSGELVDIII